MIDFILEYWLSGLAFVLVFSLLILIHEFGHFWMAKRAGIRVDEFGIGLPPRVWGKKKGETLFSVNAIPFGGFVRLYGEDPSEKGAKKSKRSFINKTLWERTKVVLGGVGMNFFLAWLLIFTGLVVGMEPLFTDVTQFQNYAREEKVDMSPYMVLKEASEKYDIKEGSYLLSVNGTPVNEINDLTSFVDAQEKKLLKVQFREFDTAEVQSYDIGRGSVDGRYEIPKQFFGDLVFYNANYMPRVRLDANSDLLGLKEGDVIHRVNGVDSFGVQDFVDAAYTGHIETIDVMRDDMVQRVAPELRSGGVRVGDVLDGSPADEAGVKAGDVFTEVNGVVVYSAEEVKSQTKVGGAESGTVEYVFDRNGIATDLSITPKDGLIGVQLEPMYEMPLLDMSFTEVYVPSSVITVEKERFHLLEAPFRAFSELKELGVLTVKMTGNVLSKIFSSGQVPEGVAGPVGIAYMTHLSVQGGFMEVLRLTALLSLSLGVLNVLPFPALDGGRFIFIVAEAITGRRVNHKFEAMVHTLGFILLLLLIVVITWNDIVNLL